jgi:hypothetical protein
MQTPHQTVFVQDLRNARFAERIAHGPPKPPNPPSALDESTLTRRGAVIPRVRSAA